MKDFFNKNWACLISVLIAGISLCVSLIRAEPFELDLFSQLISILAILVGVLISWQIVMIIDIKNIKRNLKKDTNKIKNEMLLTDFYSNVGLALFSKKTQDTFSIFNHTLRALKSGIQCNEIYRCEVAIEVAIEYYYEYYPILKSTEKKYLLSEFYKLYKNKEIKKLKRFYELENVMVHSKTELPKNTKVIRKEL